MNFNKKRVNLNRKKKVCTYLSEEIDYKDVEKLKKYVSERGKILPRRVTGACATHQRKVTKAIKKARVAGLMPFIK